MVQEEPWNTRPVLGRVGTRSTEVEKARPSLIAHATTTRRNGGCSGSSGGNSTCQVSNCIKS